MPFHELKGFVAYRKKINHAESVRLTVPAVRNSLGSSTHDYSLVDTLRESGEYIYSVFMHLNDGITLFDRVTIKHGRISSSPVFVSTYNLEFSLKKPGTVTINILTRNRDFLLGFTKKGKQGKNTLSLEFEPFLKKGYKNFIVTLKGKHIDEGRSISFD